MNVERWWLKLRPGTREWLIANNGDAVPIWIVDEIAAAGGPGPDDSWWARDENPGGLAWRLVDGEWTRGDVRPAR